MCPYPLKVQARPPRDQRLATQSRVSGREGGERVLLKLICLLRPEFEVICEQFRRTANINGARIKF